MTGVDFNKTFAPVAKFFHFGCILALGAALNWEIHQMDVKTIFFNKVLEVEIYMDQLKGFIQEGIEDLMCKKTKKALIRLKQSPRAWYHCINSFFINEGFCRSQANHSLYVKQTSEYLLVAILYVNDLIILASNVIQLKWLKSELKKEFEMSDLGKLHHCLKVEFEKNREAHTIIMNQKSYIEEILKRFNMEKCKPAGTPFDVNSKLLKLIYEFMNVQREMKGVPYKAGVRSLMYAMMATRADITFAVSTVSQFMLKAGPLHWMAVKRIMRYLKGTLDFKVCLIGKDVVLRGFCDAN